MCAHCQPISVRLEGENFVTTYSPAPAEGLLMDDSFVRHYPVHIPSDYWDNAAFETSTAREQSE
jgi:hypothetical protein